MSNTNVAWERGDVDGVWIGAAAAEGPTVTILGGVHGSERTGPAVLQELRNSLNIECGKVILGYGNLQGIIDNKRFIDINLNRCFRPLTASEENQETKDRRYEVNRAQLLLPYLDESDALLDLHDFSDPKGPKFIITEERGIAVAKAIGAPIISTGWSVVEAGGSDGYMETKGKIGLCYELGYKRAPKQNLQRGLGAVARFLAFNQLAEFTDETRTPLYPRQKPRFINVDDTLIRTSEDYELFVTNARTFDPLEEGQLIARHDGKEIRAKAGQVIIFPDKEPPIGEEAFLVGHSFAA